MGAGGNKTKSVSKTLINNIIKGLLSQSQKKKRKKKGNNVFIVKNKY